jgi:hypothetical protein
LGALPLGSSARTLLAESEVNLVYVIMLNGDGDVPSFERLLCRLYHPSNYYLVNLNGLAPEDQHRALNATARRLALPNLHVHWPPHPHVESGFSVVEVLLRSLLFAYNRLDHVRWEYVVPVMPREYPLVNAGDLRRLLGQLAPARASFLSAEPAQGDKRNRMVCKDPALLSSVGFVAALKNSPFGLDSKLPHPRLKCRAQHSYPVKFGYPVFRGHPDVLLHRDHVRYLVEAPDGLPLRMQTAFATGFLPEETYVPTVLCNSRHTAARVAGTRGT